MARLRNIPPSYPDWTDNTVVCIASGPSLTAEQVAIAHQAQRAGLCKVIAINDNYRLAPFADVLYACDERWWDTHIGEIWRAGFAGALWTCSRVAFRKHGLAHIQSRNAPGLSLSAGVIHHGFNSGYQAIGLAHQFGAARVLLLGYDMQHTGGRSHWFGEHPKGFKNAPGVAKWAKQFEGLAQQLTGAGLDVINCTEQTALTCFPRKSIGEVFPPNDNEHDPPRAGDK